jgi:hypothetical protein
MGSPQGMGAACTGRAWLGGKVVVQCVQSWHDGKRCRTAAQSGATDIPLDVTDNGWQRTMYGNLRDDKLVHSRTSGRVCQSDVPRAS